MYNAHRRHVIIFHKVSHACVVGAYFLSFAIRRTKVTAVTCTNNNNDDEREQSTA